MVSELATASWFHVSPVSAFVEGENFNLRSPDQSRPQYGTLLVTPPGASLAVRVPLKGDLCSGLFAHPVVPGASGQVWRVAPSLDRLS